MKTYKIAAIPGDGIGTEVISAGVEVLQALSKRAGSFQFKVDHFDWGGEYYKKHGRMMPVDGRDQIKNHDAILFGSASHLCGLMFLDKVGVKVEGVGYRGTGPAMADLLAGQFDFMCDQTTGTTGPIRDGKIQGYAVTTRFKVASVPNLPTLDSTAMPGFEVSAWHAMWAPKGLPKDVQDKLVAALQAALKDPKVIERFAALGTEPVPMAQATPDALKAQLASEVKRWEPVLKAAGVKGN